MAGNALTKRNVTGAAIVAYALTFQGVKYVWGGASPSGFDCSGFAQYVYSKVAGVELPRITYQQVTVGTDVLGLRYLPGDLLFFHGNSHEGISLGGSRFIHAPHTGDVVKISTLGAAYTPSAARRILTDQQAAAGAGTVPSVPNPKDTGQPGSDTWLGWTQRVLTKMGMPVTQGNVSFFLGWLKAENPADDYSWNPLATTLRTKGALRAGGVQAYKDELAGIEATVQTIQAGQYGEIRRALAAGTGGQAAWDALRKSPWDAGHYAATSKLPSSSVADATRLVVGAKKGGGDGALDAAGDAALGIGRQALDPFGLIGVGKSPRDAAEAATGAAGGALGGVEGAISGAAGTIVSGAEEVGKRAAYALFAILLGGFALVLVVRTAGVSPMSPLGSSSSSPAAPVPASPVPVPA